ncbi:right-handed parallel beta-helix repeat-containing protein [Tabrizicola sp. J26]|uniref:right-handed parallel beta-helix repeat-containing protein n=1 Tax=Alitabrizicola rongguiensis TaxID=2909234 RepID=UPI001F354206|nr:right-handed parallel beta-helix repeat-containing protein [Tabrizicola rongguiensis]MCF1711084.1 right-handed parallel beta-helix repeat-containing protein [Tabrizicola rongguiensis]
MRLRPYLLATGLILSAGAPSLAATYYVAPRDATPCASPTGAKSCPFSTPDAAMSKAQAGDTILLMDGDYDGWEISAEAPATPITIRSQNGKKARLEWIRVTNGSQNLILQNLSLWPSNPDTAGATRISVSESSQIIIDGMDVRSAEDAADYPTWDSDTWANRNIKGVQTRFGSNVTIRNSSFMGLGFAAVLLQDGDVFENNQIRGFSMDGLRVLGDDTVVRGNLITDCVRINANHPDGMQSWSQGGKPVKNLVIEGNAIIEWSNPVESANRCRLQGIGFFDGWYDNISIVNNVISSTAYHGIAIVGGRGVTIVNNTVVNTDGAKVGYPWIRVAHRKDGALSRDVTIVNNIAMKVSTVTGIVNKVVSDNSVIVSPSKVLTDITKFDYRPKPDSGFIDTGNESFAPPVDLRNYKRPAGDGPDRGAYETGSAQVSGSEATAAMALTN